MKMYGKKAFYNKKEAAADGDGDLVNVALWDIENENNGIAASNKKLSFMEKTDEYVRFLEPYRSGGAVKSSGAINSGGAVKSSGERESGAVFINCAPLNNGHKNLIKHAASKVERLFCFVSGDGKNPDTPIDEIVRIVKEDVSDIKNVVVVSGGDVLISWAYYYSVYVRITGGMKPQNVIEEIRKTIDRYIEVFALIIAPFLNIGAVFSGGEPAGPASQSLYAILVEALPRYDIEYQIIPNRITLDAAQINDKIHMLAERKEFDEAGKYVSEKALDYLREKYGDAGDGFDMGLSADEIIYALAAISGRGGNIFNYFSRRGADKIYIYGDGETSFILNALAAANRDVGIKSFLFKEAKRVQREKPFAIDINYINVGEVVDAETPVLVAGSLSVAEARLIKTRFKNIHYLDAVCLSEYDEAGSSGEEPENSGDGMESSGEEARNISAEPMNARVEVESSGAEPMSSGEEANGSTDITSEPADVVSDSTDITSVPDDVTSVLTDGTSALADVDQGSTDVAPGSADGIYKSIDFSSAASGVEQYAVSDPELLAYMLNLDKYRVGGIAQAGAVVLSCGPFTFGHRHIVERAASLIRRVYVFIAEDEKSAFPFADRFQLAQDGLRNISNITIIPGGKFVVSPKTAESFFSEKNKKHSAAGAVADLEIFARYIAPALNITELFTGADSRDAAELSQYDAAMRTIFMRFGISYNIIRRREYAGRPISSAWARTLLREQKFTELERIVPPATLAYLKEVYDAPSLIAKKKPPEKDEKLRLFVDIN